MKSPVSSGLKVMAKVKVLKSVPNFKVKTRRSKYGIDGNDHKEYAYEV